MLRLLLVLSVASLLALTLGFEAASQDANADAITSLPGWNGPLPSLQWSGYLDASSTEHLHYWFVESERDPVNDPVVFWFNGGPGCSSLDGFFYEMGPFEVNPSNYSQLTLREYRWSRVTNMVFVESPVGVGFSYSDTDQYVITDDSAAATNRAAVEAFYSKFPNFKQNKFFITGESYAGIYVPTLAEAIVQGQLDGTYTGARLTGIAVGNGCTGTELGICGSGTQGTYYEWSYLLQTGFVDHDLKQEIENKCDWKAAALNEEKALSVACVSLLNKASAEIQNVNMYNIYGDCVSDTGCTGSDAGSTTLHGKVPTRETYYVEENGKTATLQGRIVPHGPVACIDSAAAGGYLNNPEVMVALHVKDPGYCWSVCRTPPGWTYRSTRANLPRDTYPFLLQNIDVVIYNGDWDACVPYTDNEGWTENMGFTPLKSWHKWAYTSVDGAENQVAGYAVNYDISSLSPSHSFSFVTVRGGRHEVPATAPAQALEMISRITSGTGF